MDSEFSIRDANVPVPCCEIPPPHEELAIFLTSIALSPNSTGIRDCIRACNQVAEDSSRAVSVFPTEANEVLISQPDVTIHRYFAHDDPWEPVVHQVPFTRSIQSSASGVHSCTVFAGNNERSATHKSGKGGHC